MPADVFFLAGHQVIEEAQGHVDGGDAIRHAVALDGHEEQVVLNRVAEVAEQIQGELNKVQAQQRSITQTIPLLDSDAIDKVLPGLVDQYGELKVFGGGIWPLPNQRTPGRNKHSTFWHRGRNS